ncbi:hypothetical protein Scep_029812 [Stephania cephalantha]|uniref:AT-hook motif nuclear-localized protein n=1 Tax=Stephania cephalantha TaxID=152367 RepID=A0AAP0HGB6_9MAGN
MEGNDSGLSAYFHHHHHSGAPATATPVSPGANGLFGNATTASSSAHYSSSEATPLVFPPHSLTGRPPESGTVRRKRGRPRKYGTAAEGSGASGSSAKRVSASPSVSLSSPPHKKESNLVLSSVKKVQMAALGHAGQGFIPHVITVAAGEDVAQKIMSFMQQRKRAVCIMSASGSISNASIRQPASLGGNVTYEGRYEIVSLSGSFLHADIGGASSRIGGLSVCLSGSDGRIVGGGVGGPLKAAGPVQVIAGSFVIDTKKEVTVDPSFETSGSNVPHVIRATVSTVGFHSPQDSSGTSIRGNDDQCISGNNFILPPRGMHDWRAGLESSAFPGRTDHGGCQSPEDGDNDHLHD